MATTFSIDFFSLQDFINFSDFFVNVQLTSRYVKEKSCLVFVMDRDGQKKICQSSEIEKDENIISRGFENMR